MIKTLIKDAIIITLDDARRDYFSGDLCVSGDCIESIAQHPQKLDAGRIDRVIDGKNYIIMPGFVNSHGHVAMTLLRSYADDMPLKEWLEQKIWPLEDRLRADDVYWGTMLGLAEMIRGGTTTFADMYFFMDQAAGATAESGMRAVLSRGLIALGSEEEAHEKLEDTKRFIDQWHGAESGRITVTLGPHAPYTCPPAFLQKVMDLAAKTGRSMQIHLSETRGEVDDCIKEHGVTPPELLHNLGFFDYKVIAAHCVHLDNHDIEILVENKVGVAHNPGSNLKLGSGIAPVAQMVDHGVKVGIGTDGASSNNNLDMLEEMRLAALLSKGVSMDPTLIRARTALKMATALGAEALGLERVGMLKEGYRADLIGLRYDKPHMQPMHDPQAQLVYSAAAADVDLVMVDGKILFEDGEFKTLDQEKIMAEASRCAIRLTESTKKGIG